MLEVEGYASRFWTRDLNDDVVAKGAFAGSLARTGPRGVKMLSQHDGSTPVGVWDEVREDGEGLFVRGRVLEAVPQGRMTAALGACGRGGRAVDRVQGREGARRRERAAAGADGSGAVGGVAGDLPDASAGAAHLDY